MLKQAWYDKATICGVVVTYFPDGSVVENVHSLLSQVGRVFVIDNGTQGPNAQYLKSLSRLSGVVVWCNDNNLGIAAALNIGVKWASTNDYQWVVTMDQDSRVTRNMLQLMFEAYTMYPDKDRVAIIAPRYRDQTRNLLITFADKPFRNEIYGEILTTMTSGNLIKLTIFSHVGLYNEDLFIDLVDTEFCLRCGKKGYVVLECESAVLDHNLGYPTHHKVLWKKVTVGNYPPIRRYYMARNRVWLYRHYVTSHPRWIAMDIVNSVRENVGVLLFEQDRRKKMLAMLRGVYHGIIGKLGPIKPQI